ncbi:lysocardiolipin acyltransferase 1-like isoform X2 [Bolinopsis microptera]|uniref:lysocardiolipin acyltransferase 1-like isoform X2 n=1 Tax=Bolinopsis microptera TaxID=2820187 RepID=UPI0030792065
MVLKTVKGIYFTLACFASSWLGSCFIMLPSYLLGVFVPHVYRSYVQFMMGTWLLFPPSMYELLWGTQIRVSGDKMRRSESCLIVANHRTRLDWMFMWSVTGRARWSALMKIILRGDLKHLPGFGWAMQFGGFFFLSRKWASDEKYLTDKIRYFTTATEPHKLLIFPEGTDYDTKTKKRSDAYGDKEGLPHLDYVLHPRTTGFIHCVQELRKGNVPALYDMTLGYPKTLPDRGELDLITGTMPEEIHVHVQRFDMDDIPSEKLETDRWLRELWYEKEKRLENFYKEGQFAEENPSKPYFPSSADNFKIPIFVIWNAGLLLIIYLLFVSPVTRSYLLFSNLALIVLSTLGHIEDIDRKFENNEPTISEQPSSETIST